MNRRAIVIGAGFGRLALAIRLQSAGIATTIVEARDEPGGRAYHWERDGFPIAARPTVTTRPPGREELLVLTGRKAARTVEPVSVKPFKRLKAAKTREWGEGGVGQRR